MTRIAISGHRDLSGDASGVIDKAIRGALTRHTGTVVTGMSSLATSAERIFARAVLDLGGSLEVVVPSAGYRDHLPAESHATYDALLRRATAVHHLHHGADAVSARAAAIVYMLEHSHVLFAIWDGGPPAGWDDTADVVAYARNHGVPVEIIWPMGAARQE